MSRGCSSRGCARARALTCVRTHAGWCAGWDRNGTSRVGGLRETRAHLGGYARIGVGGARRAAHGTPLPPLLRACSLLRVRSRSRCLCLSIIAPRSVFACFANTARWEHSRARGRLRHLSDGGGLKRGRPPRSRGGPVVANLESVWRMMSHGDVMKFIFFEPELFLSEPSRGAFCEQPAVRRAKSCGACSSHRPATGTVACRRRRALAAPKDVSRRTVTSLTKSCFPGRSRF